MISNFNDDLMIMFITVKRINERLINYVNAIISVFNYDDIKF